MRRLLGAVAALAAVALPVVWKLVEDGKTEAQAASAVVAQVRVAIASGARIDNYRWTVAHDQVVILQAWKLSELRRLKRLDPRIIVLMYKNAAAASSSAGPGGRYATGVSYAQARANHWLLANGRGSPFRFRDYSWLWATDIGSRSYQRAWMSDVMRELDAASWDGVLIDDVDPTIAAHYCVECVSKYSSEGRYEAAMQSFVRYVGGKLRARGRLAIANLGGWSAHVAVGDRWLRYLSGAVDEQFVKVGDRPGSGYASMATWITQLGEIRAAQSRGKLFFGLTHSSNRDEHAAVYGYATELLAGEGRAVYAMSANYARTPWFPEYDYRIGSVLGAASVRPDGIYERQFSNGLVLVNPSPYARKVDLGGVYSGSGLVNVRSVMMGAHSGLVLIPSLFASLVRVVRLVEKNLSRPAR